MSKKIIIVLTLTMMCLSASAQNDSLYGFYYANGTRHYWQEDYTSANIIVRNLNHFDSIVARLGRIFNGAEDRVLADDEDNNIIVNSQALASRNISELISQISMSNNDIKFFTYAKQVNGNPIWLTNEVYVKLKDSIYYSSHIQPVLFQYPNVTAYYEGSNEFRLVCPTDTIVSVIANRLYDTAYVVYSSPDYYSLGELHTNDTYFDNQWNLKNTGQNNGTIGVDIKAEAAWNFLQKEINAPGGYIKVAVIDDGVEEHEDFYERNGVSVVLDGYTANEDGTGRPRPKNKHGECCAGIIAAVHNNIGIAGVAPKSRIVPIRIFRNISDPNSFWYMFPKRKVARAIKKSWEEFGASVLSCSWGGRDSNDFISDAIVEAATNGRNGKGCIICFSSGNVSGNSSIQPITFEAALDEVLAVGAMYRNGMRHGESCYGLELDLIAPGYSIPTTDREGNYGETNGNYYMDFQRTSAACPHVSGVAALVLSVRPELTREQVYDILEITAQKVGNYDYNEDFNYFHPNGTWNQEVGYGLVDAHMAVVEAALYGREVQLLGDNHLELCDESVYTCSIYHPDNFTFEWTTSANLAIVSTTGFMAKVMPLAAGDAFVQVDVYSEGRLVRSLRKAITITDNSQLSLVPLGTSPFSVTTNTTWSNNNHFLPVSVTVEDGATLTITGTLYCSQYAKIIVKPGGCLIVNGGKLTSFCEENMWQGIEVWGNSSTHQYEVNGSYGQGYLEMKNGAVIENAKCAVELWRPGYYSTTGGIIYATDAIFRNNAKAVHALWYTNHSYLNGEETPYNSYFHNCSFLIDEDYVGLDTFYKHVDMSHIYGISFLGCDFSVNRHILGISPWCVGIGAYESGFLVNAYCDNPITLPCPDEYIIPSSFSGFYRGIHASNDGSAACTFSVRNSIFDNNTCGVYALNTGYSIVVNNDFTVGCGSDCDFGIYADEVSSFCFEENTFHPRANNVGSPYGIVIVNSDGTNDVYRNSFANLRCGNVAIGNNAGNSITAPGLTYSCNTNSSNVIDFCVLKDGNVGDIASSQGSSTVPAGNTFGGSQYHFYNDGNQVISYYYDNSEPDQMPAASLLYRVSANGIQGSNSCVSHYGNDIPVVKSSSEKAALESDYFSALLTYSTLRQLLESRIDGGSTPTQVADISTATPDDMWRLRAQLLGLSPYVSGEVLTTAADRYDVFTDPVLFEILAANPDELKKDSLISYLESKANPLPTYMTDLLRQIASGFTARTALLAQMTQYNHAYSLAAGDIVRSNLNDSVANPTELRTWLGNMGDIASDRMIVASYLQEGDSLNAFTLASLLPELYGLQGDALSDHSDYMRLIVLHQTLNREHRTVYELTEAEALMVDSIATWGIGTSKAMAEAMLMERSGEYIPISPCPSMPNAGGGNRGMGNATNTSVNEALGFTANISPNPATTWTTVDYTLPANMSKATLAITNTLGVTVMSTELNGKQGQKVLDLRGLADGIYLYTIRCGEYVNTGKLVVTK